MKNPSACRAPTPPPRPIPSTTCAAGYRLYAALGLVASYVVICFYLRVIQYVFMSTRAPSAVATAPVAVEAIAARIVFVRGQKVLVDADLAAFYGAQTRGLVQTVKRNLERFPADFMFQLSSQELAILRSQTVISSASHRGQRYAPYAFTEQGVAMLSSVLSSTQAIRVNIAIMRAFVKLRETLATNKELALKFEELARKVDLHDQAIAGLIATIRELIEPAPAPKKRSIGFS